GPRVRFRGGLSLTGGKGGPTGAASKSRRAKTTKGAPAMNRKVLRLAVLTFLGATGTLTGAARTNETATIRNQSSHVVAMVLKWSDDPGNSGVILLAPWQSHIASGPDGRTLFIRFNATPGDNQFPRMVQYRVITRFTNNPLDPGVISVFRDVSP